MCFSATASFTAGTILSVVGIVTLTKVKQRTQIPFAAIPLLFGLQQLTEGVVWLTVNNTISPDWQWSFALAFLLFAQVIWPIWVSVAFLLPEVNPTRRKILWGILLLGVLLSLYHIYCYFNFPIAVNANAHHIDYLRKFPTKPGKIIAAIYVIVTLIPPFISSIKNMKLLGTIILLSFLLTVFFYREHLTSVWCLFAAVGSAIVFYVMHKWETTPPPVTQNDEIT